MDGRAIPVDVVRALDRHRHEPHQSVDRAPERGNLLHRVLQIFWQGRDSAALQAMDEAALQAAIAEAVEQGMRLFMRELEEPLPPQFAALEGLRLQRLLQA